MHKIATFMYRISTRMYRINLFMCIFFVCLTKKSKTRKNNPGNGPDPGTQCAQEKITCESEPLTLTV